MTTERDYVLGTHDEELTRLGVQNAVWRPYATAAWRRAGFAPGQTLVDLGCGPGWATLDLAQVVGPTGRVIGIDRSRRFLDALEASARGEGLANVTAIERDLDEPGLPVEGVDGIWSRWVYAFVREPRALLARAVAALAPGGRLVMHEYVDYRSWRIFPRSEEFEGFVTEVMASWREAGGEPDIGTALPAWLAELGMKVKSLTPLAFAARPQDEMWQWPTVFVAAGPRRLVELGRIDEARAARIDAAYAQMARTPGAFQITPAVLEIVALKAS
jgi:SAM-dependent methyltransferase